MIAFSAYLALALTPIFDSSKEFKVDLALVGGLDRLPTWNSGIREVI